MSAKAAWELHALQHLLLAEIPDSHTCMHASMPSAALSLCVCVFVFRLHIDLSQDVQTLGGLGDWWIFAKVECFLLLCYLLMYAAFLVINNYSIAIT